MAVLLLAVTMATHGWSLRAGLFLDDHWHQKQLRDCGWSLPSLLDSATIQPDEFMKTWWQDITIKWQYARPMSFFVMKVAYFLSDGNVPAQHAVCLGMHFLNACMLYVLCMWLTSSRFWSTVGSLIFIVYSHNVFAVSWLSSENVLVQTVLMLPALLFYIRASQLNVGPSAHEQPLPSQPPPLRMGLFAWTAFFWLLALFSRENAIMLPLIFLSFDYAFGGWRHAWARRYVYVFFALIIVGFLTWRLLFYYFPLPDVYVRRPTPNDGYLLWCIAKLMHYLCAAVWLNPMVVGPTGRNNPFVEVPGDCIMTVAILILMFGGYYCTCRRLRGYWIWPLWLVLSFLPVIPMMATPHCGYSASIAFAVAMILGPGLFRQIKPILIGKWCRPIAIWFLVATCIYIPIYRTLWRGMISSEWNVTECMAAEPPAPETTDVFFINIPFVNVYQGITLQENWGKEAAKLGYHVLTYAPELLRVEQPCYVEQLDARRFSVSIEGSPYFSGLLGRYLIKSMRSAGRFEAGQKIPADLFDVEVVKSSPEGISEFIFAFKQPLASKNYRFYLTSRDRGAMSIRFHPEGWTPPAPPLALAAPSPDDVSSAGKKLADGDYASAKTLLAGMSSDDPKLRQRAWVEFRRVAAPLATAMGARAQKSLEKEEPDRQEIREATAWWTSSVDAEALSIFRQRPKDIDALLAARESLFNVRRITSQIIQSDLYMTGPPFPGPS